jgi:hypothetical protein
MYETKRRSVTKSLVWRVIGILWTWIGAYLILTLVPKPYQSAGLIATLIVVYHHSTRMVMYYLYERVWSRIRWGKTQTQAGAGPPLSARARLGWGLVTVLGVALIFFLILYITPLLKGK